MNPIEHFDKWYKEAEQAGVVEPYTFVLSTVKNNQPRSRVVFWRRQVQDVFYFFTNYSSDKGEEISTTAQVAMNFHWRAPVNRQVRIQGTIAKASRDISDAYFASRPRGSQIGAWASPQSRPIADRKALESLVSEIEQRFSGKDVPRPEFWGGYGITPNYMEFWEEGTSRLHTRVVYERTPQGWTQKTIAP